MKATTFYAAEPQLGEINLGEINSQEQHILAESYDIAINTTVNGDNNNVTTNIASGNMTGDLTGNVIGNTWGNFLNFDFGGWSPQRYDWFDPFAGVTNYRATRGDVIGFAGRSLASVIRSGNAMQFYSADGSELTVSTEDTVDQAVSVDLGNGQALRAKIGNTYEANAYTYEAGTLFVGGQSTDVIVGGSNAGEETTINLQEQVGIEAVDSSASLGVNNLIGNELNNTFVGGAYYTRMWGGAFGSSDVFFGGSGVNEVFFGAGGGFDIVYNSKETDRLNLMDTSLDQIAYAGQLDENYFAVSLKTGEAILLDGNKDRSIAVAGSEFHYEAASRSFRQVAVA